MLTIELSGKKGKGIYTILDKEDFEKFGHLKWNLNNGYAYASIYLPKTKRSKNFYLHRLIMGENSLTVDHINGDKLDNRRSNLRICTQAKNNMNKPKQTNGKNNYKGVHDQKGTNKFRAKLTVDGKQMHLGYFKTEEEAAMAYNEAAYIYFGRFAKLNKVIL